MYNEQYLVELVKTSGLKKGYLAGKMGISRQSFLNKLKGKNPFRADESVILLKELGHYSVEEFDKIFFLPEGSKNVELTEE